jgi:hypothetical protein
MLLAIAPAQSVGESVSPKQIALQLRLVQAIVRAERRRGRVTGELAERASAIVEETAMIIPHGADTELTELLGAVRAEVAELASMTSAAHRGKPRTAAAR